MKLLCNLFMCIIAILPNAIHGNDIIANLNTTLVPQKVPVDRYINEYLDAEEHLWTVIAGVDTAHIIFISKIN